MSNDEKLSAEVTNLNAAYFKPTKDGHKQNRVPQALGSGPRADLFSSHFGHAMWPEHPRDNQEGPQKPRSPGKGLLVFGKPLAWIGDDTAR